MGLNKRLISSEAAAAGVTANYIDMDITYQLFRSQVTPSNSARYTFSFWINFNSFNWTGSNQTLIATGSYPSPAREEVFNDGTTGKWKHNFDGGSTAQGSYTQNTAMSLSTGQWYHFVINKQAGSAPTYWLNSTPYYFSGSVSVDTGSTRINSGSHYLLLFRPNWGSSSGVDAKVAHIHFIDGYILDPTNFSTLVGSNYVPAEYSFGMGNNSSKILMANTSDILNDTSGFNNDMFLDGTLSYGSDTIITS